MSNVLAISWREQVTYWWDDDNGIRFVLDQDAELDYYSSSLLKQSTGRYVAPLGHIILISNQPV
jgi:hypothetical protein